MNQDIFAATEAWDAVEGHFRNLQEAMTSFARITNIARYKAKTDDFLTLAEEMELEESTKLIEHFTASCYCQRLGEIAGKARRAVFSRTSRRKPPNIVLR